MIVPASGAQNPVAKDDPDALLVRAFGVRQLAAHIFNYTVGSGIFALPAFAVAKLGAAAPLAYLACALVMAGVVLCFAEAGSRVSATGGPYAYVEVALGPLVGFVGGVLLFLTGVTAGAAVAVLFARSCAALIGSQAPVLSIAIIVAVIAALAAVNVRGVDRSARAIEIVTVAKLVPLIGFVLLGAVFVHPGRLEWDHTPPASAILGAAGVVIFAFSGIESALTPSGEIAAPARTVPRAAFLALGAATLLYLAVQWVALGLLGLKLAANDSTPLADAAAVFAGPLGRTVMIVGASISMLGYLSGNLLAVPRTLFAFARDGFLPRSLSAVHPRYRSPHVAIVLYAVLVGALALSGTFERLAVLSNLAAFVLYILCAIAVWVLRRRDVRTAGEPFRMPWGPLIPIATVLSNLWLIGATAGRTDLIGMAVTFVLAVALYGVRQRFVRSHFP
jgi:APA family basic amino acid/polyamine antiporter